MPELSFVGREHEMGLLLSLLDGLRDRGAALVVAGQPGIGKSTLLAHARAIAGEREMLVLATAGVPPEANLPFAGLHRLLRPVLAGISGLPVPQRQAVRTAFGMSDGPAPEPFLIALGALGLISDAAARRPLLLSVEDAQWLDRPTADVLAFAGRRIEYDPIVMLAALRDGYDSPLTQAGMPELRLGGLTDEESGRLLDHAFPGLPEAARARVLAAAEGNPLALCELPAAEHGIGEDADTRPHLPLTSRLEEAFAARAAELPPPTRTVLRLAATAQQGVTTMVLAAAEIVDGAPRTIEDLVPAIQARLIEVNGHEISFRHPLIRSAIYQAATVAERHAAHTALASLLAGDADRRVWHRWAAAIGPDPAISAEVEEAGRRALGRGAAATAAVAFERAAILEQDAGRRGRLLLEAAAAASDLGRGETVTRLLGEAAALGLDLHEQARWMWLDEGFRAGSAGDPARVRELVRTASQVASAGDRDLAMNLLVAAASRCYWGDLRVEGRQVLRAADLVGAAPDDHRMLYLRAFAAPVECGPLVLAGLDRTSTLEDPAALYHLRGMAVCLAGAFDRAEPLLAASARQLRAQGRLSLLARVLTIQAWAAVTLGNFAVALPAAEEARRLAAETQQVLWRTGARVAKAALAAMRGDRPAVQALAAEADSVALPAGAPGLLSLVQYARGLLELGQGRHAEAYQQLRRIRQPGDPACHYLTMCHTVGDFTEAAVRSGHRDEALAAVADLEGAARRTASPKFRSQMLFARLHLAGEQSESAVTEALDQDLSAWPIDQARFRLAHGEWLRRHRRQVESRAALRAARDSFDAIGATSWAERARLELRAAGESSPRRERDSFDRLTAQELQIVQLVAQGLTNGAIAERLYLSRRTVESHLYHAFPKLGVSSRAELAASLSGRPGIPAQPPAASGEGR